MTRKCPLPLTLLLLGALLPACRGGKEQPTTRTVASAKPDLERLTRKCDDSLGLCRLSLLPDLKESRAGKLSLLAIILAGKEGGSSSGPGVFGFQVSSKKVRFRDCQQLTIRAKGGPDLTLAVRYDQALATGHVVEGVTAELDAGTLARLAVAEEVTVKLCGQERPLRPDEQALLGELMRRWRNP